MYYMKQIRRVLAGLALQITPTVQAMILLFLRALFQRPETGGDGFVTRDPKKLVGLRYAPWPSSAYA